MSNGQCRGASCGRQAHTRGFCETHYRRRLHTGRYGYRDAATVAEHIQQLRALGWTWEGIGDAAGVSSWVPLNVHRKVSRRILAESETALLDVPLVPFESHRGVDATGPRRRVQALAWMGWPNHEIARRVGCSPRSLPTLLARGSLSARLAHRIAAVYEELSTVPGPSRGAAGKARQLGFVSPWAWDDETIDDPEIRAAGVKARAS